MMKKLLLIFSCLLFSVGLVYSQKTITVTGTVIDDAGIEVVGASVVLKGTTTGVATDINGAFSLNVPENSTLVFSLIGMETVEAKATPNMSVVMKNDEELLEEVVVTAIGISRSEKALGYAVSSVKSDELVKARESNIINSLAGKVSGIRVTSASGGVGASSKIIIRGANSMNGDNQPLFVIDGLPIDNGSQGSATNNVVAGGLDNGNRAGDINPDDVESMTVLKGAAATALYGARAKNGAIIITTKRGTAGSKPVIEVNSSVRFESVLKLPKFQNEYSQGVRPVVDKVELAPAYDLNYANGWGEKINGQTVKNFLGQEVALQAYPDNVKDFFNVGESYINSVSVSGGGEKADYRVGVSSLNQSGIIPEASMNRYNITMNVGYKFSSKLSSRTTFSYISNNVKGRAAQSSNNPNVLISSVYGMPRNLDLGLMQDNWRDAVTGEQIGYDISGKNNNPYWIINKNKNKSTLSRFIIGESVVYQPTDWLTITNNFGLDYYNESRRQVTAKGTFGKQKGGYTTDDIKNEIFNNDLLLTAVKNINSDLELKVMLGHNVNQRTASRSILEASDLTVDGLYNPSNAATTIPTATSNRKRIFGVFGEVGLAYKNFWYVSATGRNDWSSTLPASNRSYFYPSISSSLVFTELMEKNNILDFGNIRINWANVGSDEDPYQIDYVYSPASTYYVQYSLSGNFPHLGLLGFSIPRVQPNKDLKPQNQTSFEIGSNLKFFGNRVGIDFTYYNVTTSDQIVAVDVPISTGFFAKNMNIGKVRNRGLELTLSLVPVETKDFLWNIDFNYAANKQVVLELVEDNPDFQYGLASGWSGLQVMAKEGESFGMYGTMWERNENGDIVIDGKTGLRKTVSGQRIGDIAPKWTMGINNYISYKGISLSCLIDIRQGGLLYSGTVNNLRSAGLVEETAANRETAFIDKGVVLKDGEYVENTTPVKDMPTYWQHMNNASNTEGAVFDASYIKLRELRVGYQLPKNWIKPLSLQSAEIAFEGRNLWIIKDHVPHIDPEASMFGVNSAGEGVEFNTIPSTKSLGVNVRLKF